MELSTGQQRALFAVLVLLLAGIGIYLLGPGRSHGSGASPAATVSPAAATSSPTPLVVPSAAVAPTTIPVPQTTKGVNIYNWLPFTAQDLNEAVNVTLAFAVADQTFSSTDTAATYGQRRIGRPPDGPGDHAARADAASRTANALALDPALPAG